MPKTFAQYCMCAKLPYTSRPLHVITGHKLPLMLIHKLASIISIIFFIEKWVVEVTGIVYFQLKILKNLNALKQIGE